MNEIEILMGGREITVAHADGRTETIKVRKVPIRHLDRLGRAWGKEAEEVAVYADRKPEWVDTLTDESFEQIIEIGRELNEVPFAKWFKRQEKALEAIGQKLPDGHDLVEKIVREHSLNSSSSSSQKDTPKNVSGIVPPRN